MLTWLSILLPCCLNAVSQIWPLWRSKKILHHCWHDCDHSDINILCPLMLNKKLYLSDNIAICKYFSMLMFIHHVLQIKVEISPTCISILTYFMQQFPSMWWPLCIYIWACIAAMQSLKYDSNAQKCSIKMCRNQCKINKNSSDTINILLLTQWSLVKLTSWNSVNTGSCNGLLLDGNKQLPAPMSTYHQ